MDCPTLVRALPYGTVWVDKTNPFVVLGVANYPLRFCGCAYCFHIRVQEVTLDHQARTDMLDQWWVFVFVMP